MSPPSANLRSGTKSPTPTEAKDPPSTAHQSKLGSHSHLSSSVAIHSSSETGSADALTARSDLCNVFMNPNAAEDPDARKEFGLKLVKYVKDAGPLNTNDVLFDIAIKCFGMKRFKLVLVGAGGVGKTAFLSKHVNGQFVFKYEPTHGAEVTSVVFLTSNYSLLKFDVWDTAGVDKNGQLRDGYYINADCAVLMYDMMSTASLKAIPRLFKDLARVCANIPIVVTGNKADIKNADDHKVKSKLPFLRQPGLRHIELSVKSGLNIDLPILHLARTLLGDNRLRFVTSSELDSGDESDVANSTSQLSLEDRPPKQADVAEAKALSLPPSNDDDGGL